MRKKIDWNKYFVRTDLGFTKRYLQNGLEYDENGLSIRDFPTEQELDEEEVRTISKMKLDPKYIFSRQSQQPYQSLVQAKAAAGKKKLDMDKVKFHEFKRGVIIEYNG